MKQVLAAVKKHFVNVSKLGEIMIAITNQMYLAKLAQKYFNSKRRCDLNIKMSCVR
jgi:hypothetical protein